MAPQKVLYTIKEKGDFLPYFEDRSLQSETKTTSSQIERDESDCSVNITWLEHSFLLASD